jgi:hypothetical protein
MGEQEGVDTHPFCGLGGGGDRQGGEVVANRVRRQWREEEEMFLGLASPSE